LKTNDYNSAANFIRNSKHTVVFSGAGISVESGIPPFRGENGLWNKYNPIFLDTSYFRRNPKKSWKLIKEIFYDFFGKAKPNQAHYTVAELEKEGLVDTIITQNIDNLHQEAGSKNVIEFHGTSRTLTCMDCHAQYPSLEYIGHLPPNCPKCDGLLKPDFVFFGEPIPQKARAASIENAAKAEVFILVGTTGEIMPASSIPYVAKKNGAKFIEINIEKTKFTPIVNNFLQGKATEVFLKLKEVLK
jgi:NAD-dependent deacetylase